MRLLELKSPKELGRALQRGDEVIGRPTGERPLKVAATFAFVSGYER